MQLFPTSTVLTTDWPYGRLRAEVRLSVEFNKRSGFRTVFQSQNPKTLKWNAPKKSTYSQVVVQTKDEKGHISSIHLSFNVDTQKFNENLDFMAKNFDLFTPAQHEYIYLEIAMMVKVKMMALVQYCGASQEAVKEKVIPTYKAAVQAVNSGENRYESIKFNVEEVEALKVPGYNPFRTSETFKVSEIA